MDSHLINIWMKELRKIISLSILLKMKMKRQSKRGRINSNKKRKMEVVSLVFLMKMNRCHKMMKISKWSNMIGLLQTNCIKEQSTRLNRNIS